MSPVKHTSGGTFDKDHPRVYFIAGNARHVRDSGHPNVLVGVNEIDTAKTRGILDELCDTRLVLLDSGIFNLAMGHARAHDVSMDTALKLHPDEIDGFAELRDRYYEVVTRYADRLWGFIELDQGGAQVKPETRARIEKDTGLIPMPVYHPLLDGWSYYDELAKGYDRICFGNLVKAAPPVRLRLIHTAYERARKYPELWTHLLGVYPNENLLALPMRGSFDSSSWMTSLRWMSSWKAWTLFKMVAHYPPDIWYSKGTCDHAKRVNAVIAQFTQRTLDATMEDTHPC